MLSAGADVYSALILRRRGVPRRCDKRLDEHHRRKSLSQRQADRPGLAGSAGPLCNRSVRIRLDRSCSSRARRSCAKLQEITTCTRWRSRTRSSHTSCQSSTSMSKILRACSWWRAQPVSWTAKSAMARPRSSLAIPSSSAFATDRSARIPARQQLESSPALLQHGVDYVLHAILDFIVDGCLAVVVEIEEEVLETEQRTLNAFLKGRKSAGCHPAPRDSRFQRVLGPIARLTTRA